MTRATHPSGFQTATIVNGRVTDPLLSRAISPPRPFFTRFSGGEVAKNRPPVTWIRSSLQRLPLLSEAQNPERGYLAKPHSPAA